MGAYLTENYTNLFKEYGYDENKIEKRLDEIYDTIFMEMKRKDCIMKQRITWHVL